MTRVRLFAAAAEAAGIDESSVDGPFTLAELRSTLSDRFGAEFEHVLRRCAVLVDGTRLDDDTEIPADATVDILPPFAGG